MNTIRYYFLFLAACWIPLVSFGQVNPLFDQSNIAKIYVTIPQDTLNWIYANINSNRYFRSKLVFRNGVVSDTIAQVGFRLRGNTSRSSAKKSFKISFNTFQSGRRYRGVKKINLNGQHNDPTMIREKLYYDIWNKLKLPQRRTSFVEVYINNDYYGLYTNLEEMDSDWLSRVYGTSVGNLYKCTYPADLVYIDDDQQTYKNLNNSTASGGRVYELETNSSVDDYNDLVRLIKNVHEANGPDSEAKINEVLNVELWLKVLALDVATGHWDNYGYNKNNFYLHHNPYTNKFDFISYDTDNTFGVDWLNIDWAQRSVSNWIHPTDERPLASRVLNIPSFKMRYFAYLDSISKNVLHPFYINSKIDSMKAFIRPSAIDDIYRTLDYGYDLDKFDLGFSGTVDGHTPYGIKPFLAQRASNTIRELSIQLGFGNQIIKQNSPFLFVQNGTLKCKNISKLETSELAMFDGQGKLVNRMNLKAATSGYLNLKEGIYFYQIREKNITYSGKFNWSAN